MGNNKEEADIINDLKMTASEMISEFFSDTWKTTIAAVLLTGIATAVIHLIQDTNEDENGLKNMGDIIGTMFVFLFGPPLAFFITAQMTNATLMMTRACDLLTSLSVLFTTFLAYRQDGSRRVATGEKMAPNESVINYLRRLDKDENFTFNDIEKDVIERIIDFYDLVDLSQEHFFAPKTTTRPRLKSIVSDIFNDCYYDQMGVSMQETTNRIDNIIQTRVVTLSPSFVLLVRFVFPFLFYFIVLPLTVSTRFDLGWGVIFSSVFVFLLEWMLSVVNAISTSKGTLNKKRRFGRVVLAQMKAVQCDFLVAYGNKLSGPFLKGLSDRVMNRRTERKRYGLRTRIGMQDMQLAFSGTINDMSTSN